MGKTSFYKLQANRVTAAVLTAVQKIYVGRLFQKKKA